jgi:hypothetical protein
MLIPLMHFILLAFLPLGRMRASIRPAYAAGCGQFFFMDRQAYRAAGGHSAIRASRHDGITLPRAFRTAGFTTDLFDLTAVARCRMYTNAEEVVNGLLKNATEGLAAPSRILPITLLFLLGQVVPFILLPLAQGQLDRLLLLSAVFLVYLPRAIAAVRFRQSLLGAVLHPLSILLLLLIQWWALFRLLTGASESWKGRSYSPSSESN